MWARYATSNERRLRKQRRTKKDNVTRNPVLTSVCIPRYHCSVGSHEVKAPHYTTSSSLKKHPKYDKNPLGGTCQRTISTVIISDSYCRDLCDVANRMYVALVEQLWKQRVASSMSSPPSWSGYSPCIKSPVNEQSVSESRLLLTRSTVENVSSRVAMKCCPPLLSLAK